MKPGSQYILMLEDDGDDQYVTQSFFREQNYNVGLEFVTNPDELLPYLDNCDQNALPFPCLIILDKYMNSGSSMATLKSIKSHPIYSRIPVVVVSGSDLAKDIEECYQLGANSYIVKPQRNDLTAKKIASFVSYWFEVAELPEIARNELARMYIN